MNKHYDNWLDTSLDTKVKECIKKDDKYFVTLDDTVFYFESGGQSRDKGTINGKEVVDLIKDNGNYYHVLNEPVEGNVHLKVDVEDRKIRAEIHSAQHLFCCICNKKFNAPTIAFFNDEYEIGAEMDFEILDDNVLKEIEDICNDYILKDSKVEVFYPTRQEASEHVKLEKMEHDELRGVKIADIDYDMCGCIHVPSLKYLQLLKIVRYEKTSRGYKIFFLVGDLLKNTYSHQFKIMNNISTKLSSPIMEIDKKLDNYIADTNKIRAELETYKNIYIEHLANNYINSDKDIIVDSFDNLDNKSVQKIAILTTNAKKKLLFFVIFDNEKMHLIVSKNKDYDFNCAEAFKNIASIFNLKGGGNPNVAQGGGIIDKSIVDYIKETYGKYN